MKRILLILVIATSAVAQQQGSVDEMMASYAEMSKPVPEHRRLEARAGKLDVTTKLWLDPTRPPVVFRGSGEAKMILGGRFLQVTTKLHGKTSAEALQLFGFDTRTNEYTLTGFDTLGTYAISAAGKYDETQNAMILAGSYLEPPTNEERKYRFVMKGDVFSLYFAMPDGKEMLVAETTYRKVSR